MFVGNISNDMDAGEFEEIFTKLGSCIVRMKVSRNIYTVIVKSNQRETNLIHK